MLLRISGSLFSLSLFDFKNDSYQSVRSILLLYMPARICCLIAGHKRVEAFAAHFGNRVKPRVTWLIPKPVIQFTLELILKIKIYGMRK